MPRWEMAGFFMRFTIRDLLVACILSAAIGCQPDGVVSLEYDGFSFEGCGGEKDFCECWVSEEALNRVYLTLDEAPGRRLSEVKMADYPAEDYPPISGKVWAVGTPQNGSIESGVAMLVFKDGKMIWASIRASAFKISGSADGPFIKFEAVNGKGPTKEAIEAAFGKPKMVGRAMGRRGP